MRVRTGSLEEALFVLSRVPELDQVRVQDDYAARLQGKRHLILIAEHEDSLVGFKVGYELDPCTFYSWVGGVVPNHRRLHLARTLLAAQEEWASEVGYARIRVKTHERFGAMLKMLQENNYVRVAEHNDRDGIVLERALPDNALNKDAAQSRGAC